MFQHLMYSDFTEDFSLGKIYRKKKEKGQKSSPKNIVIFAKLKRPHNIFIHMTYYKRFKFFAYHKLLFQKENIFSFLF